MAFMTVYLERVHYLPYSRLLFWVQETQGRIEKILTLKCLHSKRKTINKNEAKVKTILTNIFKQASYVTTIKYCESGTALGYLGLNCHACHNHFLRN